MIRVTICLGNSAKQHRLSVELAAGATVQSALLGAADQLAKCDSQWQNLAVAVFGKMVKASYLLSDGDQIELLANLVADPMLARRRRVELRRKAQGRSAWTRNSRSQNISGGGVS